MAHPCRFAWGSYILSHLYHDLHQVVYHGDVALSMEVLLLQAFSWEHLLVTKLIGHRDHLEGRAYIYSYRGVIVQPQL